MSKNTPKIRPLGDRLVVEPKETAEEKTAGGILIPDTSKEKPSEGTVVAIGDGKWNTDGKKQPLQVKIGDRILYGKYAGTAFKLDKEYLVMREDDVMGILE